jgi:uncharacterized protein YggE
MCLAAGAFADATGKVEVTGHGVAKSAPEYYSLTASVISMCYDKATEAQKANAELAQKIVDTMNGYLRRGTPDKVTTTGGASVRETEYADSGTMTRKVICERKWRTTNLVTLESGEKDKIPELQDALLQAIDQADDVRPDKTTQTYAQLGGPSFRLYPATEQKLQQDAAKAAWDDAVAQFSVFKTQCGWTDAHVSGVSRVQYLSAPHFADAAPAPGTPRTPIIPDEMQVQANWNVTWSFTPGGSCFMLK